MTNVEECTFEPCNRPQRSKGLCNGHYMQQYGGRPLTPLHQHNRVINGFKKCPRCAVTKSVDEYYLRSTGKRVSTCNTCSRELAQEGHARASATGAGATNKKEVDDDATQIKEETE